MIKLMFCLRRLPHLTREQFQDYWFQHHAALAKRYQPLMGTKKYVQVHTITSDYDAGLRGERGSPEPYDGVAESWFESWDALRAVLSNPEAKAAFAAMLEDEKKFIDLKSSPLWFAEEKCII